MTLDERMKNEVSYREKVGESIPYFLFNVYEDLAENHLEKSIPSLQDVIEFTYADMYMEIRDNMISHSVDRGDHELHEMTPERYLRECYSGNIEDVAIEPHIDSITFRMKILEAIMNYQLFVEDNGTYENQPITGVW